MTAAQAFDSEREVIASGMRLKRLPPLLEAQRMSKRVGDLIALDDVSFRLAPGTFHALLGENGAG